MSIKDSEDMSMEEILASIRQYVAGSGNEDVSEQNNVIHLKTTEMNDDIQKVNMKEATLREPRITKPEMPKEVETSSAKKALFQLKSFKSKRMDAPTADITLSALIQKVAEPIIHEWLSENMEAMVEKMVNDKIKELMED